MQGVCRTLKTADWLVKNLKRNSNLKIIDATWVFLKSGEGYKDFYQKQHIPGAEFFDLDHCCQPTKLFPCPLPDPNCLSAYIGSLGVTNDTQVILYDQTNSMGAFKAWWLFKYFGHDNVSVLNGGLQQWLDAGQLVTDEVSPIQKLLFLVNRQPQKEKIFGDIADIVRKGSEEIVDVRPAELFHGDAENGGGHIANSKNVPYMTLFNEDGCMKSEKDLKNLLKCSEVDLTKPLVSTCQVGVSACGLIAAAERLGKESSLYVGSWNEWSAKNSSNQLER